AMIRIPDQEEICRVIMKLNSNKSPGPDGFTSGFFKATCSVLGSEVTSAIQNFFITAITINQPNGTRQFGHQEASQDRTSSHGSLSRTGAPREIGYWVGDYQQTLSVCSATWHLRVGIIYTINALILGAFGLELPIELVIDLIKIGTNLQGPRHLQIIRLLAWQCTLYYIWAERNSRLHRHIFKPPDSIVKQIEATIRSKISALRD
ncbi:hypothetical protein HID58_079083, partial [Brassica napus]